MELDERKRLILQTIVKTYLETGEPVGSRTLSKLPGLEISPATIRNEMSDLEAMGYIVQPHTSAGRIPSDKGYRLYVDSMMEEKEQEVEEMKKVLNDKADKMETLLETVAKFLASNTNCASMVTTPKYRSRKIKFIQLTDVDLTQLLAVILIEGNIVKNKVIKISEPINKEMVLKLNIILNTYLQGLDLAEISLDLIQQIKMQADGMGDVVNHILDVIAEALGEEDKVRVYTSGSVNILQYPELADVQTARKLLYTIEDKKQVEKLISADEANSGVQVFIGDENESESMKDCSLVTTTYEIEEGVYGRIGIVGPKRMDYDKIVGTLKTLRSQLDDIFHRGKDE